MSSHLCNTVGSWKLHGMSELNVFSFIVLLTKKILFTRYHEYKWNEYKRGYQIKTASRAIEFSEKTNFSIKSLNNWVSSMLCVRIKMINCAEKENMLSLNFTLFKSSKTKVLVFHAFHLCGSFMIYKVHWQ